MAAFRFPVNFRPAAYAETNKTFRARGSQGAPFIGVDHGAGWCDQRMPSDGHFESRRESRRRDGGDTAGTFSASFFERWRDAKLRSYLAAREGLGR
jgi:hypothetical protein